MLITVIRGISAYFAGIIYVIPLAVFTQSTDSSGASFQTRLEQEEYLLHYNYLSEENRNLPASLGDGNDPFTSAVTDFQHMAGLPETGYVDEETKRMMLMPRCGVADHVMSTRDRKRKRRFTAYGSHWSKTNLTYRIVNFSPTMSQSDQEDVIKRAFTVWSTHSPLTFTRMFSGIADIMIMFAKYSHGDNAPFDGPGRVLAHAYFPPNGDVHLDNSETFTVDLRSGVNLFQVFAHELGHSLGLSHSSAIGSLMGPFYRGYQPNFVLHSDDIAGIQYIYGKKTTSTIPKSTTTPTTTTVSTTTRSTTRPATTQSTTRSTTTKSTTRSTTTQSTTRSTTTKSSTRSTTTQSTTRPTTMPSTTSPTTTTPRPSTTTSSAGWTMKDFCADGRIDDVTVYKGKTYFFKGDHFVIVNGGSPEPGYPKKISEGWPGLPNDIDGAVHLPPLNAYFFLGWRFYRRTIVPEENYFFKGSLCWLFNANGLASGYPKTINSVFRGVPDNIDAAFVWGGDNKIFFTKGDKYFRVTRNRGLDFGYPKSISVWNIPHRAIDAAVQWKNGQTYLFKDSNYYRLINWKFTVGSGYPQPYRNSWLGCPT